MTPPSLYLLDVIYLSVDKMKKILILTKFIPYELNNWWCIRNYAWIKHLSHFFEIHLIWFARSQKDISWIKSLCHSIYPIPYPSRNDWIKSCIKGIAILKVPLIILKYFHERYLQTVKQLLNIHDFESIFCLELATTQYLLHNDHNTKKIYDSHNIEYLLFSRVAKQSKRYQKAFLNREAEKIKNYEYNIINNIDYTFFVSQQDYERAKKNYKPSSYKIVPNSFSDNGGFKKNYSPFNLFFIGNLSRTPNKEWLINFMQTYLPRLKEQDRFHKVKFYIIGSGQANYLTKYLSKNIICKNNISQEEKNRLLSQGWIGIVPLNSWGGTRIKILEYRSYGLPVLSTVIGAEWLISSIGTYIYNTPQNFIKEINILIHNKELFGKKGKTNYLSFQQYYHDNKIFENIDDSPFSSKSSQ